jgi:phenylpyruvate tautomerase PptA (4-oxalocrotonate tautomerase family)
MPFYSCNVPAGSLTDNQKDELAKAITRIHAEVSGAPPDLVHVIYNELAAADSYTAGEPSSDTIITGHIRAHRAARLTATAFDELYVVAGELQFRLGDRTISGTPMYAPATNPTPS